MFHKKTFTLVEEKSEKKMYSAKNVKWVKYLIILALVAFVLLLILANVKSKSYYRDLNASKKPKEQKNSGLRSILSLDDISTRAIECTTRSCTATCSGDMRDLSQYLESKKSSCPSMSLEISSYQFLNDRLERNWLKGGFNLTSITITGGDLSDIESGAFDQNTVAYLKNLKLDGVRLQNIREDAFVGLKSIGEFTLINKIQTFSGEGFLKPMFRTLTQITIKHVSNVATDPAPWLRGEDNQKLTAIVFDGSNLGGYINTSTFEHFKELNILFMNSCKITYIPHGTFDFLMERERLFNFVYVSLQGNQLKQLSGDYLAKVSMKNLRTVDIENNPWECTCELEQLIEAYTNDPTGFSSNPVKCSTPDVFAGKVLSDVVVGPCEDTTTAPTTTLPTTTQATTLTISSSPSTETPKLSTTTLLTESSTTFTEPASSSTEVGPTTSLITTLSTSTLPSPTSTESSTTIVSTETSSTSTDSAPELNTSLPTSTSQAPDTTTALTTLSEEEPTSPPAQTTPSPQNRTTTLSSDTIFIQCQRYTVKSLEYLNPPAYFVELSPPDANFDISPLSQTSVQLKIEDPTEDLALIWFYNQPNITGDGEDIRIVGEFKVGCQSELEDSLLIEGLAKNRTYTFCLVKEGIQVISPFNCRSYCTTEQAIAGIDESEVWLKYEDKALTLGLFIFGAVISLCIGIVGMFVVLRFYPTLLKGSKRVIVVNRSTGDVLIMPRPGAKSSMTITDSSYRTSSDTNTTIRQRRFSDTSIQSGRSYMMANNYEDIEYRWKMNVVNDMIYANRVPKSPPPPLPKRTSQTSTNENVDKMKVAVVQPKGNDYGYIA